MTGNHYAVSYRERPGMPEKWAVVKAERSREAAIIIARSLPGYEVTGVYKQTPEWAWRCKRYE